MTAALVLDPVRAAAAVNGLLPVLPLPKVTCLWCGTTDGGCPACNLLGTVPQSVPPGTYLVVASRDDNRHAIEAFKRKAFARMGTDPSGPTWIKPYDGIRLPLHPGSVVGSVTVTAAPPISVVDIDGLRFVTVVRPDGKVTDLSSSLPWLGDPAELVGQTGVLVENAATTEQRCPACVGELVNRGCIGCWTLWTPTDLAPVPVPDDVALSAGTVIELELT